MFNPLTSAIEKYMDVLSARQKVVASNIANADTPGYKTRDVNFQSEFAAALNDKPPAASEVGGLASRNDGNNVDLDREARLVAENALRFQIASGLMRSHLQQVRSAIREGKGA